MIFGANWKMKMGWSEAEAFLSQWKALTGKDRGFPRLVFFPPALLAGLFEKENFYWGGQNAHQQATAALTGENSPKLLKEMGADFCLLGHSERRWTFGESEVEIEKKFQQFQQQALIPVLCVGEPETERFKKERFLLSQFSWIKKSKRYDTIPYKPSLLPEPFKAVPFIIAYEPLWAIGSGKTPSVQEITDTVQWIKEHLGFPSAWVLYGGSVDKALVESLAQQKPLDGFLLGGASLDPKGLYEICKASID